MSPFGHKEPPPEPVGGRAIVLSPIYPTTGLQSVDLAVELPDGRTVFGSPTWSVIEYLGTLRLGARVPVTLPGYDVAKAQLDDELMPADDDVAAAVREALGGPVTPPRAPNEWRVGLALQYAEQLIALGSLTDTQADAVRARLRAGV